MTYFIVYNIQQCFNIYSTEEKAIKAVNILRQNLLKKLNINENILKFIDIQKEFKEDIIIIKGFQILKKYFYICKIKEGEAFGFNLHTLYNCPDDQSVIIN